MASPELHCNIVDPVNFSKTGYPQTFSPSSHLFQSFAWSRQMWYLFFKVSHLSLQSLCMMVGCGTSVSERFTAEGDGETENDTSSCCVSLVLKQYLDVEGIETCLWGKRRAPGPVYNEPDEESSLFLGFYLVCPCGGVCLCDCVRVCMHLGAHFLHLCRLSWVSDSSLL